MLLKEPPQEFINFLAQEAKISRRSNPCATFQPSGSCLRPAKLPWQKAKLIPIKGDTIAPSQIVRTVELSRPGVRPKEIKYQIADEIDPDRVSNQRGSYTVEQLKYFLGRLGLSKQGRKPDLIARLRQAVFN